MPQQTWQNLKLTDISFCRSFSVIFKCYLVEKGEFHASLMETLRNLSSYENTRWLKVLQLHRTARENPGKASQTFPSNKMIDGKPILFSDWIKKTITRGFSPEIDQKFAAKTRFFLSRKKVKNCVENKSNATNNAILSTKMCSFLFQIRFW